MAKYEIKDGVGIIPEGTTKIEDKAFEKCLELTSIVIPDSVREIGVSAFRDCTGLTSIVIPDSVTEIGKYAFDGCTGLTSIAVSEGNRKYDSRNICNAIIKTASNTLVAGCSSTVIPESVTEIFSNAFDGCDSLSSIVIPASVERIDDGIFKGCDNLKAIYCHVTDPAQIEVQRGAGLGGHQATLYVPAASLAAYKKKAVWKKFAAIKPMDE